jgi:hypothetical protein
MSPPVGDVTSSAHACGELQVIVSKFGVQEWEATYEKLSNFVVGGSALHGITMRDDGVCTWTPAGPPLVTRHRRGPGLRARLRGALQGEWSSSFLGHCQLRGIEPLD